MHPRVKVRFFVVFFTNQTVSLQIEIFVLGRASPRFSKTIIKEILRKFSCVGKSESFLKVVKSDLFKEFSCEMKKKWRFGRIVARAFLKKKKVTISWNSWKCFFARKWDVFAEFWWKIFTRKSYVFVEFAFEKKSDVFAKFPRIP